MAKRMTTKPQIRKPARKAAVHKTPARKRSATSAPAGPPVGSTPASSRAATSAVSAAAKPAHSVTIRHYCQGIGDCHLLRFPRAEDEDFFMLIDCGVHSSVKCGSETMAKVVADIASVTKRIDVLALTHEHLDHLSAFITAAEEFKTIDIGDVWLAWTENPRDSQAQQLDKYKGEALAALQLASGRLDGQGFGEQLDAIGQGLTHMLGFYFGAAGDRVRSARDAAVDMAKGKIVYREPGEGPLPLPGVLGINVYVLGPPRDENLLGLKQRPSEMYGEGFALGSPMARALTMGFGMNASGAAEDADWDSPFDPELGMKLPDALALAAGSVHRREAQAVTLLRDHYIGSDAPYKSAVHAKAPLEAKLLERAWRRIDADWLSVSADLAMQLDQRTNNTSLVLAFEFAESKRVLLFAADAQVGNWLSWQDLKWGKKGETTGPDLLKRAVFYKVGHHGSHNATLKKNGLELMNSPDLSAFIPVNEADATNIGWGQMPFNDIVARLDSLTNNRTVRADDDWVKSGPIPGIFAAPNGSLKAVRQDPGPAPKLWVEFDLA
jgi:hypothetical protein